MRVTAIHVVLATGLAAACSSQAGEDGEPGAAGEPGQAGVGVALRLDVEAPGLNCAGGGTAVRAGPDANANGLLEVTEITTTAFVCNGTDGEGVVARLDAVAAGNANCPNGGAALHAGPDQNANGVLDNLEIQTTTYVCHIQNFNVGAGLTASGSTISADQATIESWARGVCYDTAAEVTAQLASYDANAADDLTTSTSFAGAVTGTYGALALASGVVTNQSVASNAAIDPTKIAGTAWTGQNDGTGSGLDADLLDGSSASAFATAGHDHNDAYQAKFGRTVVVSPTPGNATASGNALRAAIAGITDATDLDNVVVLVEPGSYDLGANGIDLPANVHMVGQVQGMTQISSANPSGPTLNIDTDWFVELRHLNISHYGGTANAVAIRVGAGATGSTQLSLRGVSINASQGTTTTVGLHLDGGMLHSVNDIRMFVASTVGADPGPGEVIGIRCTGCVGGRRLNQATIIANGGASVTGVLIEGGGLLRFRAFDIYVYNGSVSATALKVVGSDAVLLSSHLDANLSNLSNERGVWLAGGGYADIRRSDIKARDDGFFFEADGYAVVRESVITANTNAMSGPATAGAALGFTELETSTTMAGGILPVCYAVHAGFVPAAAINACP